MSTPRWSARRSAAWSSTRKICIAWTGPRRTRWWRTPMASGDEGTRLLTEALRFVELLRRYGLVVGSGQAMDAVRTLTLIDLSARDDVYAALRAVLLDGHAHEAVFAQLFDNFWRGLAPLVEELSAPVVGYAPERRQQQANGNGRAAEGRTLL